MTKFIITQELLNSIIEYLQKKPWEEVNYFIQNIHKQVDEQKTTKGEKDDSDTISA